MKLKLNFFPIWLAGFLLAILPPDVWAGGGQPKQALMPKHKVIFQVTDSDPQKWYLTLSNAKNVQLELGEKNVAIEIVVYGPGLDMVLLESEAGEKLDEAMKRGVRVVACENTMIGRKLDKADMYPGIDYVKAGVVELMEKQRQGYAYIRP